MENSIPNLIKAIRVVLAIPATSTPSERRFNIAGLTITKTRTRLKPTVARDLLLVQDTSLATEAMIEAKKNERLVAKELEKEEAISDGAIFL